MAINQDGTVRWDLTNILREYQLKQENFVADKVFALAPVEQQSATISVIKRDSMLRLPANMKKSSDGFPLTDTELGDHAYNCKPWGLAERIDGDMQTPPGFDVSRDTSNILATKTLILAEQQMAETLQDVAVWDGSNAPNADATVAWATVATSTPVADVVAAAALSEDATGVDCDTLVLNRVQLGYMLASPEVRAHFPGAALVTRAMMESQLAAICGLSKLYVTRGMRNSSKKPGTFTAARTWDSNYVMVCKTANPGDSIAEPAIGRTLLWGGNNWQVTMDWMAGRIRAWELVSFRNHDLSVFDPLFGCLLHVTPGS